MTKLSKIKMKEKNIPLANYIWRSK